MLEDSDEFISLGEGKGSYQYSDGTLVLKDIVIEIKAPYVSGIHSYGTLIIVLDGNNSITTHGYEGIMVSNGDLTIKGDGSLIISNKGDGYDEDIYYYNGLYVGGDLTIDDDSDALEAYLISLFDSIAKDVNIVRNFELTAQKASLSLSPVPQTGDNAHAEVLLLTMLAAGIVCVYIIRKKAAV